MFTVTLRLHQLASERLRGCSFAADLASGAPLSLVYWSAVRPTRKVDNLDLECMALLLVTDSDMLDRNLA